MIVDHSLRLVSCFFSLRPGTGGYFRVIEEVDQTTSVESRYTVRGTVGHAIMTHHMAFQPVRETKTKTRRPR